MLWLLRFIGFVAQAVLLEFVHIFGLIVFLITIPLGYFRAPWWVAPALAVISGLFAHNFIEHTYLTTVFDRVVSTSNRSAFVIIVYLAITIGGYVAGLLVRFFVHRWRRSLTRA